MVGVVMHRYMGSSPSGNMANADQLKIIFGHIVVGALDLDSDPLPSLE